MEKPPKGILIVAETWQHRLQSASSVMREVAKEIRPLVNLALQCYGDESSLPWRTRVHVLFFGKFPQ